MGIAGQVLQAENIRQTAAIVYLVTLLFAMLITGLGLFGWQRMWVV